MVQCRLFSLHSAFSIVSENAIKSTEVSLLYKYAILRSHETGGLMTKSKGIILWTDVHGLYGRTALGCMHGRPKGIRTDDQRLLGRSSIDFLVGNHVTMWLKITKKRVKMQNFLFQIVSKSARFPNDIMLCKTTFCWLFITLYQIPPWLEKPRYLTRFILPTLNEWDVTKSVKLARKG